MSHMVERIIERYHADMAMNFVAIIADDLPMSYESVSDQWLTNVLCGAVRGARVVSHDKSARDNGSSNRMKIRVTYNEAGTAAGLPTALFCKASHDLENRIVLGVSGGALGETLFYNEIRPLLPIEAPTCHHANYCDESHNSILVLGDLSASVKEFCSHETVMTEARAESQMRLLATLHGRSASDRRIVAETRHLATWPEFFANTMGFGMREAAMKGLVAAAEVIPEGLYARRERLWSATEASVALHETLPHTLTHGDAHLKNWYVAGNGEMGLSDWQCCTRAHWGRDLAYALTTALTIEDRRAWERDLIALYLSRLEAEGGAVVPFEVAWTHYRQQMLTALAWCTVTLCPPPGLPDMQPRDVAMEFIRRIAAAMDDVGSLDAF